MCRFPAGVESEGIYRKSGQKSKITGHLEALKKDARSVVFTEDEPVDNVSDTLKRFFREIGEGIFAEHCRQWLHVTGEKADSFTYLSPCQSSRARVSCGENLTERMSHFLCI